MADPDEIFTEGFDKYGTPDQFNNLSQTARIDLLLGEWSSWSASPTMVAALSGTGYAMDVSGGTTNYMLRSLRDNYRRTIGGFTTTPTNTGYGWTIFDSGTIQISLYINGSRQIEARRGSTSGGTLLGTGTTGMISSAAYCIEYDILLDASAGWVKVWINGVPELSLTGIDTTQTANNTYNEIAWFKTSANCGEMDHIYSWHYLSPTDSGETPCLDNPVIDTTFATSDHTAQLTIGAQYFGRAGLPAAPGDLPAFTLVGGRPTAYPLISPISGTLDSMWVMPGATAAGTSIRLGIYSDASGYPGTLLAESVVVTGLVNDTELELTFSSPPSIVATTKYWIVLWSSVNIVMAYTDATTADTYWYNKTWGGSFDGTFSGSATGGSYQQAYVRGVVSSVSGSTNWVQGQQIPISYGLSYNVSSTTGEKDLYGFGNLTQTADTIHCVGIKAQLNRSASGSRTASLLTLSSATEDEGSYHDFGLSSTILTYGSYWLRDPNGDITWTQSNLQAAKHGVLVGA